MTKLEKLDKRFRNHPLLVIKNYEHNPDLPMKDFVLQIFTKFNTKEGNETMTKARGKVISYAGAYRSVVDVYGLCRTYYKGTTLEDVMRAMFELTKEKKIFGRWFCHTINRYVFSNNPGPYEQFDLRMDKMSLSRDVYMEDLIEELGYKNEDFLTRRPAQQTPKKSVRVTTEGELMWGNTENARNRRTDANSAIGLWQQLRRVIR